MGAGLKKRGAVLGIRGQLIGAVVILAISATTLIGVICIKVLEQNFMAGRIRDAVRIAELFAATEVDMKLLKQASNGLVSGGMVSGIRLIGPTGDVLIGAGSAVAVAGEGRGETVYFDDDIIVRHVPTGGPFWMGFGEMTVFERLPGARGLAFTMPGGGIEREVSYIRRLVAIFAAVDAAIIIIFGGMYLSSKVIRPMRAMERAASRIAGGEMSERVAIASDDEIGSLARSFDSMADALQEKMAAVERANAELLAAQEKLILSEKLATAGVLSAGIAHEIGNPLGAVQGYLDILLKGRAQASGEEAREILERMDREVGRISGIVGEFLDLARPAGAGGGTCDVNATVEEAVRLVEVRREGARVETVLRLAPGLARAAMGEGKLRQVLVNLLLNAVDAAGAGRGRVIVESRSVEAAPSGRGRAIMVSITDTGCGISEDEARHIFDPFYTTKGPGRGTGLGLFVTDAIVKAHGGEIMVRSAKGDGATFDVLLREAV